MKKEITQINIDDYIRKRKREGQRRFYWYKKEWAILVKFVEAATCGITYYGMPYGKGIKIKNRDLFMGARHIKAWLPSERQSMII